MELAELMDEMLQAGKTHLVMEVSSHALDQRRTAGIPFAAGVFTNLSGDHLDYHRTMDVYLAAKRRLFESLGSDAAAVVNMDDPAGPKIALATAARVIGFGLEGSPELTAEVDRSDAAGTRFSLVHGAERAVVSTSLIGRHNVMNCLAAAGACLALGVDPPVIAAALEAAGRVAGRLERVGDGEGFSVFVDYAHTDDALANVLSALRPVCGGRLILVFGCGGDRDRSKRPRMAAAAERGADRIVVTSDNPRSEAPSAIIEDILEGLSREACQRAAVREDRREAVELAIAEAAEGDIVLIAGKGHETYQETAGRRVRFDDAEAAAEALRRRRMGR